MFELILTIKSKEDLYISLDVLGNIVSSLICILEWDIHDILTRHTQKLNVFFYFAYLRFKLCPSMTMPLCTKLLSYMMWRCRLEWKNSSVKLRALSLTQSYLLNCSEPETWLSSTSQHRYLISVMLFYLNDHKFSTSFTEEISKAD